MSKIEEIIDDKIDDKIEEKIDDKIDDDDKIEIKFTDLDQPKFGYPDVPLVNDMENTTGLNDDLTPEEKENIIRLAKENLIKIDGFNEDKNLDEDKTQQEYKYVIVSFVGPTLTAKTDIYGLRINGAFKTIAEAKKYISKNGDNRYDTYIIEMYKFIPSYPGNDKSQEELDKFLNSVISEYKLEREIAKQEYECRKNKLKANKNRIKENELSEEELEKLRKDLEEKERKEKEEKEEKERKEQEELEEEIKTKEAEAKEYLNPANNKIAGQNYVAISYVGNDGSNKRIAIKIKGIFDKYEEATEFCKEMAEIDDTYDIIISEMYSWVPSNPKLDNVEFVYTNDKLNTLFNAHKEEKKIAKKHHIERSNDTVIYHEQDIQKLLGSNYTTEPSPLTSETSDNSETPSEILSKL